MKSKKDIDIRHQYLRELKEQFAKGQISHEELYSYVLNELKTMEPEESFDNALKRFFKRKG